MPRPCFVVHSAAAAVLLLGVTALGVAKAADQASSDAPAAASSVVKVTQGEVQGTSADGVSVYKGLPFAAPPVGDLRWRAPQPAAKWQGVRAATAFSSTVTSAECFAASRITPPPVASR